MEVNDEYVSIQTQNKYNCREIAQWILIGKWGYKKIRIIFTILWVEKFKGQLAALLSI